MYDNDAMSKRGFSQERAVLGRSNLEHLSTGEAIMTTRGRGLSTVCGVVSVRFESRACIKDVLDCASFSRGELGQTKNGSRAVKSYAISLNSQQCSMAKRGQVCENMLQQQQLKTRFVTFPFETERY